MRLREESQGTMQFVVVINDYHQHFIISSISTRGMPRFAINLEHFDSNFHVYYNHSSE
jgi:hypothetical protein